MSSLALAQFAGRASQTRNQPHRVPPGIARWAGATWIGPVSGRRWAERLRGATSGAVGADATNKVSPRNFTAPTRGGGSRETAH
jgi:hypothetical protein